jgi:hypothetical protein
MPTLQEVLKAANVKEEVIAGLPPDVVAAITGFVSQADTTLQTAAQKDVEAKETLRLAQLADKDTKDYVANYGISLTEVGSAKAEAKALRTYLESLKAQGFDVEIPAAPASGAAAVVPGSPAMGGNAVDYNRLKSEVRGEAGAVMSIFLDANNEHIRLFGTPIPDSSQAIANEAAQARKPLAQYLAEKYQFAAKRKEKETADYNARVAADAKKIIDAERQKDAERLASNPNLRQGETSRSSVIPIKHDEFEKANGNIPHRERMGRMLEKIRKDTAAIRQTA